MNITPSLSKRKMVRRFYRFTHGRPDGRNVTRGQSRFRVLTDLAAVLLFSGVMQLQAGFAHFLVPVIPAPPRLHPSVLHKIKTRMIKRYRNLWIEFPQNHDSSRESVSEIACVGSSNRKNLIHLLLPAIAAKVMTATLLFSSIE
jgi:hypothetical protein